MHERRFRTGAPSGFKKIERADGVGIKIVKGNGSGAVVRRLCRGVHDDIRSKIGYGAEDFFPIANIGLKVRVLRYIFQKTLKRPTRVAFRPKENSSLVIVDTEDAEAVPSEVKTNFRSNQTAGARDKCSSCGQFSILKDKVKCRQSKAISLSSTIGTEKPLFAPGECTGGTGVHRHNDPKPADSTKR